MEISEIGTEFLNRKESLQLVAYQDQAGIWTIGYGSLIMPNGKRVKEGDSINEVQALLLRDHELYGISRKLDMLLSIKLKQCQWDALISFCYNVGVQAFRDSTLRRIINTNPNLKQTITNEFMRWNKIHRDGKLIVSKGLVLRRKGEVDLYFSC